jgi:hypothetical protein
VRLQEWPRAAWEALPTEARPGDPCWAREELALPGGRAVLHTGVAGVGPRPPPGAAASPGVCPAGPADTVLAEAYLGETVVVVIVDDGPGNAPASPYNTRAGFETVLRALQPRIP